MSTINGPLVSLLLTVTHMGLFLTEVPHLFGKKVRVSPRARDDFKGRESGATLQLLNFSAEDL